MRVDWYGQRLKMISVAEKSMRDRERMEMVVGFKLKWQRKAKWACCCLLLCKLIGSWKFPCTYCSMLLWHGDTPTRTCSFISSCSQDFCSAIKVSLLLKNVRKNIFLKVIFDDFLNEFRCKYIKNILKILKIIFFFI